MSSRSASTSEGPRAGGTGRVVVVATPIGNLGDLSPRAVAALASSDYVYCEDTRRALKLFSHAAISGPRLVHTTASTGGHDPTAIARAKAGATIAIRPTPARPCRRPGVPPGTEQPWPRIPVEAVPGPSAPLAAHVVSGLATERWCFEGFLPRSGRKRTERLAAVAGEAERAVVLFESPHRIQRPRRPRRSLADRPVAVCRG